MTLPGFTANSTLYQSSRQYRTGGKGTIGANYVVPANCKVGCARLNRQCSSCLSTAVNPADCEGLCAAADGCWDACLGGGGGGGSLGCCEFLVNPSPGSNCKWCGAT